jgi:hypothetical protein
MVRYGAVELPAAALLPEVDAYFVHVVPALAVPTSSPVARLTDKIVSAVTLRRLAPILTT